KCRKRMEPRDTLLQVPMIAATSAPSPSESFRTDPSHPRGANVDPVLVEETRSQIRQLIQEITQLSQADISLDAFYDGFLTRVVAALAASGGAIWSIESDGRLQLQYQANLAATGLTED